MRAAAFCAASLCVALPRAAANKALEARRAEGGGGDDR
eukprot:gene3820-7591_t